MKIKDTTGIGIPRKQPKPLDKPVSPASTGVEKPKKAEIEDKVSLSSTARGKTTAGPVQEAQGPTETEGPLPDPRRTAQKILEKELEAVFRETYL